MQLEKKGREASIFGISQRLYRHCMYKIFSCIKCFFVGKMFLEQLRNVYTKSSDNSSLVGEKAR
ncbi:hypothetical protein J2Z49_001163 [Desulfofundulus luciae]|uniref:Uncharacterized protein n=1 Tax=Desulfofundulus luciae TaxID=74702 RepID=A0ABU0B1C3_9FIRM|nr:hypothetical protein [Desulfofundulus luciae]